MAVCTWKADRERFAVALLQKEARELGGGDLVPGRELDPKGNSSAFYNLGDKGQQMQ